MMLILLVLFATIIFFKFYLLIKDNFNYWKKKNVPHLPPKLLFGNCSDYILFKKNYQLVVNEICEQFPNEPYVGAFFGTKPVLIVKDPNLVKLVLAKDFYYFSGRENTDYAHKEAITANLFFNGGDKWKVLRQNLTPLFTSAKLKNMFHLIKVCTKEFETFLEEELNVSEEIDVKSTFARFTMECIMNCAFGLRANTFKRDIAFNPFTTIGGKIFETSPINQLKIYLRAIWPSLFYGLGFKLFDEKIDDFFNNLFTEACKRRSVQESTRNDFVDLILGWKNEKYITGDKLSNFKTGNKEKEKIEVDKELLAGQCTLIFSAGFETTSSTISFLLYELAKSKSAQEKVLKEVDEYFVKYNGVIEYECVNEMPYTEACIEEALRLHPVLGVVTREVMDDYILPTGLRLQKGDRIHIPINHLHRNLKYFPDPTTYRPERFFGEGKKNIKPYTFMPFSEGPRICIGVRFARMVLYAGLLTLFKKYRIELAESTPLSLEYKPVTLVTQPATDVYLKLIPREG
ncbi:unnamed protein product [Euphydryas editha]|uniref:unspecific monooxygenase n=1 Tax=Euphydryas editha TaxID=104508 RepID=A0AAU9U5B8_EUPED|nr:unnamed protein product [Euphydryas editha]